MTLLDEEGIFLIVFRVDNDSEIRFFRPTQARTGKVDGVCPAIARSSQAPGGEFSQHSQLKTNDGCGRTELG